MSIPLSYLVSVSPSVIQTGAGQNTLYGLMLSRSSSVPFGRVLTFTNADDVGSLLGKDTLEYQQAVVYFSAYSGASTRPSAMNMAYLPSDEKTPIQAALWGGSLAGKTLDALKEVRGALTLNVNGKSGTAQIDLSQATSFSQAASEIQAALWPSGNGGTVTWNIGLDAFVITAPAQASESDGTAQDSTITTASGPVADALALSGSKGGITTPSCLSPTAGNVMDILRAANPTWASFFCAFDPQAQYLELAKWANGQNSTVMAALHDTALTGMTANALSQANTLYDQAVNAGYNGVFGLNGDPLAAAFASCIYAAVDFTQANGFLPFAGRTSSSLAATVSDRATAAALDAKGISYIGNFAGPVDTDLTQLQSGGVSGPFAWADAYMGQIWFNRRMQHLLALMLRLPRAIPYTRKGDTIIAATLQPAVNDALSFGLISQGVNLSEDEALTISTVYGQNTLTALQNNGYAISVAMENADPATRGKRQAVTATVIYTQGGSVQRINLNSIEVQ
ncbi:hypothetical protein CO583_01875 [Parasaccharibacter sp. TMW2.1882]|uniref:DUF3383 family protein n=1 Tax=Parasaccharibacter sp. TMW2.1882 TaxID=2039286 RepID=UPI002011E507|nr:DUF3383 family protein [Parasaccharibacter sp. TMW2.1882]MCL1496258.1 hypothetical protein [Parasaccharibacter sp. TMW2.1882]